MAITYDLNISNRLSVLQTAKLKDGTDVTDYISKVVCSLTASESEGENDYSSYTDSWVSLTPPADHTGSYVPYADIKSQPDFVTTAANIWASDELKSALASQVEAQKTAPQDKDAPWS
jgi:hypothetical protein|tara:strand:+ start:433 stop:786 length:354 start_codon:yes stop_codon:yes gene_type:complete